MAACLFARLPPFQLAHFPACLLAACLLACALASSRPWLTEEEEDEEEKEKEKENGTQICK